MSFYKVTNVNLEIKDVEILNNQDILHKTAGMKLPDGFTMDPDYVYLKVKAVSAGEYWGCNKNQDYFPEEELLKNYKTFLAAHVFKNHDNKKVEAAIGDVLVAEWNDEMKAVYLIIRIDKKIAPSVARGFEKDFMTDVSMGCRVDHVECSYCHKKARTRFDYCEHLKTMKGKIMDNGVMVYEINIGPKFHDISAVLNGAERTAKAVCIYTESGNTEKKASENSMMEKIASMNEKQSVDSEFLSAINGIFQKKEYQPTISDAKYEIQKIASEKAIKDLLKEKINSVVKMADFIKLNYTEYMSKEECISLGKKIRDFAKKEHISPEFAVDQFLKTLNAAFIELSPVELHDIVFEALNFDTADDLRRLPVTSNTYYKNVPCAPETKFSIGQILQSIAPIMRYCHSEGYGDLTDNPYSKIKAIIIKRKNLDFKDDDIIMEKMKSMIPNDLLIQRSNLSTYVIPRLERIVMSKIGPSNHSEQFSPINMIKIASADTCPEVVIPGVLAGMLTSAYQNDHLSHYPKSMEKTAGLFDKKLLSKRKIMATGVPLLLSYSALQRSRINNGEDISSLNRYIAENPMNALFLSTILTDMAIKPINNHSGQIIAAGKKVGKALGKFAEYNIFNDNQIDKIAEESYNTEQLTIIKCAAALIASGDDDKAMDILSSNDMSDKDVDQYLKYASQCYKIGIEKNENIVNSKENNDISDIFKVSKLLDEISNL